VQYIVAGTPNLMRALSSDPRWRLVLERSHVSLFEAVGREPSMVDADGWAPRVVREGYLRGGGYEYEIEVAPSGEGKRARSLRVKTSWSPAWRAYAGDLELPVMRSEDALVDVVLPVRPPRFVSRGTSERPAQRGTAPLSSPWRARPCFWPWAHGAPRASACRRR
jgi:hypothetical protein